MNKNGKVGAFWVLPGLRVVGEACALDRAEHLGGWLNGPQGHDALWPAVAPLALRSQFYGSVPRGRVVYRSADNLFVLYAAPEIVWDSHARSVVEVFFGLDEDGSRKQWQTDPHYVTQRDLVDEDGAA